MRAVQSDSGRCKMCGDFTFVTIYLSERRVTARLCDPCREAIAGTVISTAEREADSRWLRARNAVLERIE